MPIPYNILLCKAIGIFCSIKNIDNNHLVLIYIMGPNICTSYISLAYTYIHESMEHKYITTFVLMYATYSYFVMYS